MKPDAFSTPCRIAAVSSSPGSACVFDVMFFSASGRSPKVSRLFISATLLLVWYGPLALRASEKRLAKLLSLGHCLPLFSRQLTFSVSCRLFICATCAGVMFGRALFPAVVLVGAAQSWQGSPKQNFAPILICSLSRRLAVLVHQELGMAFRQLRNLVPAKMRGVLWVCASNLVR